MRWQKMNAVQTVGEQGVGHGRVSSGQGASGETGERRWVWKVEHRGILRRMVYMWAVIGSYGRQRCQGSDWSQVRRILEKRRKGVWQKSGEMDFFGGAVGIHLPMQGTRVRSLGWEDSTCLKKLSLRDAIAEPVCPTARIPTAREDIRKRSPC